MKEYLLKIPRLDVFDLLLVLEDRLLERRAQGRVVLLWAKHLYIMFYIIFINKILNNNSTVIKVSRLSHAVSSLVFWNYS